MPDVPPTENPNIPRVVDSVDGTKFIIKDDSDGASWKKSVLPCITNLRKIAQRKFYSVIF